MKGRSVTFDAVDKRLPWRAAVPAPVMAAEGAVIAVVGLIIVNTPASAAVLLIVALGGYLLVHGALRLLRYLRAPSGGRDRWDAVIGAPGTAAGLAAVLFGVLRTSRIETAALLFGLALVVSGALEGSERLVRRLAGPTIALFALPAVQLGAGLLLVILATSAVLNLAAIGGTVAGLGVALLVLGLARMAARRQGRGPLAGDEPEDPAVVASRSVRL